MVFPVDRPATRAAACSLACLAALLYVGLSRARAADPLDWPNWRGPQQNSTSPETGLPDKWDPRGGPGSHVLWKRTDLGTRSTPIVMNGKLYVLAPYAPGTHHQGEQVVCLDAATGKDIWSNHFNVYLSDVPETRVGWSHCVGDPTTGRVFALGVAGTFQCLDGQTGKTIWSHSMSEEYGLLNTFGGRTNVPVIFENLVIVSGVVIGWGDMAKPAHRFLAFDKNTGEVVWFNGTRLLPEDTTYSTPALGVLGGQAALVFGSGDGAVWAFQPRTGVPIWKYQASKRGINTSPIIVGDRVYIGHSEENLGDTTMGNLLCINGVAHGKKMPEGGEDITDTGTIWQKRGCNIGKSSPVPLGDKLLAIDDKGILFVFDAATGHEITRKVLGKQMHSTALFADGKIYFGTDGEGHWFTLRLAGSRLQVIQQFWLPKGEVCLGSAIASHGRMYVPTSETLYCLADSNKEHGVAPMALTPAEQAAGGPATHLQLVPAEVLLKPGEKQKFEVRLFNARGQSVKIDAVPKPKIRFTRIGFDELFQPAFSVDGPGHMDQDGTYTAARELRHSARIIMAKLGDLVGTARVRVVPPLPWKFDFSDGQVPVTWIGCRYRHVIREVDGNKVMVKITTIPKGTQSQGWMGPVDLHDYTIEADVRGGIKDNKMPDIGLTDQRYVMRMIGPHQTIELYTWAAVLEKRFYKLVPFAWKPDVWYTMKLRVDQQEGKALVRGKVWPRGEREPAAWTIEATDDSPNLTGSPGLYANSTNAEVYYDNLTVTPNAKSEVGSRKSEIGIGKGE